MMQREQFVRSLTASAALGLCAAAAAGQTPAFDLVGLPPGGTATIAYGLSVDGATAVGAGGIPSGVTPGFVWTRSGGRYDFGLEPGMPARTDALAVSSDGVAVAGYMRATTMAASRAYRWSGSGLPQDLGVLAGHQSSWANGISGDGNIVVGQSEVGDGGGNTFGVAFRWTEQTGMQALPHLRPGGSLTQAKAVSRDGSTIVGLSRTGPIGAPYEAFRWTQGGGMVPLPGLPGVPSSAWEASNAVSADGSVIVGHAEDVLGDDRAVRWTSSGVEDLGTLPGAVHLRALAVSDDGQVIGGTASMAPTNLAFVWTPGTGMISLADHLASSGVVVPQDWRLRYVYAISGDGLTFAGEARSSTGVRQGFVATVPAPSGAIVVFGSAMLMMRRRRAVR